MFQSNHHKSWIRIMSIFPHPKYSTIWTLYYYCFIMKNLATSRHHHVTHHGNTGCHQFLARKGRKVLSIQSRADRCAYTFNILRIQESSHINVRLPDTYRISLSTEKMNHLNPRWVPKLDQATVKCSLTNVQSSRKRPVEFTYQARWIILSFIIVAF